MKAILVKLYADALVRKERIGKILGRLRQMSEEATEARKQRTETGGVESDDDRRAKARHEERCLINELSALRLEQAEDRMINIRLTLLVSSLSGVLGLVVGVLVKHLLSR